MAESVGLVVLMTSNESLITLELKLWLRCSYHDQVASVLVPQVCVYVRYSYSKWNIALSRSICINNFHCVISSKDRVINIFLFLFSVKPNAMCKTCLLLVEKCIAQTGTYRYDLNFKIVKSISQNQLFLSKCAMWKYVVHDARRFLMLNAQQTLRVAQIFNLQYQACISSMFIYVSHDKLVFLYNNLLNNWVKICNTNTILLEWDSFTLSLMFEWKSPYAYIIASVDI